MKTLYEENTYVNCFFQNRRGFSYILGTITDELGNKVNVKLNGESLLTSHIYRKKIKTTNTCRVSHRDFMPIFRSVNQPKKN